LVAPDESARSREVTLIWAVARRSRYVSLRFTSRDLRRASQEPNEKGTGGQSFHGEGRTVLNGSRLLTTFSRGGRYWVASGQFAARSEAW
jgi:hypothetical protein